ncbi:hypothetical protein BBJ28_00020413 [Nothophytophthora sp. Chile5]|nr:hypothetical protein BBJ28_00020413 [Nothophytophthora sp. Chile5]
MRLEALNEQKHDGATAREISQLPIVAVTYVLLLAWLFESMLQATEDASCAVCLSAFQVGTRVRMLRCFHRFHPDCIDPWLKDKATCPICKFPAIA